MDDYLEKIAEESFYNELEGMSKEAGPRAWMAALKGGFRGWGKGATAGSRNFYRDHITQLANKHGVQNILKQTGQTAGKTTSKAVGQATGQVAGQVAKAPMSQAAKNALMIGGGLAGGAALGTTMYATNVPRVQRIG